MFQSLGWEDPLEKEMATHSSILARKSPGQRSLAGYSRRGRSVGHDLSTMNNNKLSLGLLLIPINQ